MVRIFNGVDNYTPLCILLVQSLYFVFYITDRVESPLQGSVYSGTESPSSVEMIGWNIFLSPCVDL